RHTPASQLLPYTTLFRSRHQIAGPLPAEQRVAGDPPGRALEVDLALEEVEEQRAVVQPPPLASPVGESGAEQAAGLPDAEEVLLDRKSTRLNSSHVSISY